MDNIRWSLGSLRQCRNGYDADSSFADSGWMTIEITICCSLLQACLSKRETYRLSKLVSGEARDRYRLLYTSSGSGNCWGHCLSAAELWKRTSPQPSSCTGYLQRQYDSFVKRFLIWMLTLESVWMESGESY